MPVRKLKRSGTEESCGTDSMISGGTPHPLGEEDGGPSASEAARVEHAAPEADLMAGVFSSLLADQAGSGAGAQSNAKGGETKTGKGWQQAESIAAVDCGPAVNLRGATAQIITALRQTKEELAKEMEANLKQLKAVLKESQRISKDMEAVLKELKAEGSPEEQTRGTGFDGSVKGQGQGAWTPPDFSVEQKKSGDKKAKASDQADEENLPPWQPPMGRQADGAEQEQQAH